MSSTSTLQMMKSCPLKYRLYSIIGLRKIEDESAEHHLRFGSAFHAALEVVYKAHKAWLEMQSVIGPAGLSDTLRDRILTRAKTAFLETYPKQLDESDNAKTQESGLQAI